MNSSLSGPPPPGGKAADPRKPPGSTARPCDGQVLASVLPSSARSPASLSPFALPSATPHLLCSVSPPSGNRAGDGRDCTLGEQWAQQRPLARATDSGPAAALAAGGGPGSTDSSLLPLPLPLPSRSRSRCPRSLTSLNTDTKGNLRPRAPCSCGDHAGPVRRASAKSPAVPLRVGAEGLGSGRTTPARGERKRTNWLFVTGGHGPGAPPRPLGLSDGPAGLALPPPPAPPGRRAFRWPRRDCGGGGPGRGGARKHPETREGL